MIATFSESSKDLCEKNELKLRKTTLQNAGVGRVPVPAAEALDFKKYGLELVDGGNDIMQSPIFARTSWARCRWGTARM